MFVIYWILRLHFVRLWMTHYYSPPFHFKYQHSSATSGGTTTHTVTIGEGAVQLGGFTHFIDGGSVSGLTNGTN